MATFSWTAVIVAGSQAEYDRLTARIADLASGYRHPVTVTEDPAVLKVTVRIADYSEEVTGA